MPMNDFFSFSFDHVHSHIPGFKHGIKVFIDLAGIEVEAGMNEDKIIQICEERCGGQEEIVRHGHVSKLFAPEALQRGITPVLQPSFCRTVVFPYVHHHLVVIAAEAFYEEILLLQLQDVVDYALGVRALVYIVAQEVKAVFFFRAYIFFYQAP